MKLHALFVPFTFLTKLIMCLLAGKARSLREGKSSVNSFYCWLDLLQVKSLSWLSHITSIITSTGACYFYHFSITRGLNWMKGLSKYFGPFPEESELSCIWYSPFSEVAAQVLLLVLERSQETKTAILICRCHSSNGQSSGWSYVTPIELSNQSNSVGFVIELSGQSVVLVRQAQFTTQSHCTYLLV